MDRTITIPKPLKLRSADAIDESWCAVAEHLGTDHLLINAKHFELKRRYSSPRVRFLNEGMVLLVDCVAKSNADQNAVIFDANGKAAVAFHAGQAISDVVATKRTIVFGFHDNGALSDNPIAREGVAVFDLKGRLLHGYRSTGIAGIDVMDCYCMCNSGGDEIAFIPYPSLRLVKWDSLSRNHSDLVLPKEARGPHAISIYNNELYVYGSFAHKRKLLRVDGDSIRPVLDLPSRPTALRDGRLLITCKDRATIIAPKTTA